MDANGVSASDLNDRGVSHARSGRFAEAAKHFRQALVADPKHAAAQENLAKALAETGDLAAAAVAFRKALEHSPRSADLLNGLGVVLSKQKDYAGAIAALQKAIDLEPGNGSAYNNLGIALASAYRPREAVVAFRRAIDRAPSNVSAFSNLGLALVHGGRPDEAVKWLEQALSLRSDYAEAHCNLGIALTELGRLDDALSHYARALELNPDYHDVRMNRSATMFLKGDYEQAWQEYEFRFHKPENVRVSHAAPRWDGTSLAGKTLLLEAEQGMGDTIQFVRYAAEVKRHHNCRIVLAVERPLVPLLTGVTGVDELLAQDQPRPKFDIWSPLLSVPGLLGKTASADLNHTPYLQANPERVSRWKKELEKIRGIKIGIAWQGTKFNKVDHRRSFPLRTFSAIAKLHGLSLVSLQKGEGSEQLETLTEFDVVSLGSEFDTAGGAFLDTAAVMQNLDLVITADTSVGHLAGALGVPVWLPLALAPDWRWGMTGDQTPWYPTMRLFRQTSLRDWNTVFERMAQRLLSAFPQLRPKQPAEFVITSSGFNRLAHTQHGPLIYNANDLYVGRSLAELGEFSEGEIDVFRQCVPQGGTIVEAGAHVGAHTIPLARIVGPSGCVHAIEPQRILFQTLAGNIALNSLTNVRCHLGALADKPGEIIVPQMDYTKPNHFGAMSLGQYAEGDRVPVITVDGLGLSRCDLLKFDVEGMELAAVRGAEQTIRRCRPLLYVTGDLEHQRAALIEALAALEYNLFWHLAPTYRQNNYYANPNDPFGRMGSIGILGVHSSLGTNIRGLRPIEGPNSDWRVTQAI